MLTTTTVRQHILDILKNPEQVSTASDPVLRFNEVFSIFQTYVPVFFSFYPEQIDKDILIPIFSLAKDEEQHFMIRGAALSLMYLLIDKVKDARQCEYELLYDLHTQAKALEKAMPEIRMARLFATYIRKKDFNSFDEFKVKSAEKIYEKENPEESVNSIIIGLYICAAIAVFFPTEDRKYFINALHSIMLDPELDWINRLHAARGLAWIGYDLQKRDYPAEKVLGKKAENILINNLTAYGIYYTQGIFNLSGPEAACLSLGDQVIGSLYLESEGISYARPVFQILRRSNENARQDADRLRQAMSLSCCLRFPDIPFAPSKEMDAAGENLVEFVSLTGEYGVEAIREAMDRANSR